MAAIGNVKIGFQVQTGQLKKGLDKGRSALKSFGSAINPLKGGMAGLVGGFIAAAGAALTVRAAIRGVSEQFSKIDHLAKFSKSVGVSIDELRGLSMAAGLSGASGETLEKSLVKMNKLMGEAQLGFGAGAKAFSDLGIEMEDLEGLGTADALGLISDKIKAMPNEAQKTAASMTLMGRSGSELAGFLELGSDKIKEMIDENTKLQGSISDMDAAGIENMNDSLDKLKSVFEGVFQQVAIKVAPIIGVLIDKLTDTSQSGLNVGAMVSKGFDFVVSAVGFAADAVNLVRIGFLFLQSGMTKGLGLLIQWWGFVGKQIESVVNLLPGVQVNFSETLTAIGEDLDKLAGEQFANAKAEFAEPPPSEKLKAFINEVSSAAQQAAKDMAKANPLKDLEAQIEANKPGLSAVQSLQDQIIALKIGADAAAIFKLEQQGVSKAIIEQVKALQSQKSALEESQKTADRLKSAAESVLDSLKSPLDKFGDKLGELKELFNKGLIDSDQFVKAAKLAKKNIFGDEEGPASSSASGGQGFASVALAGSSSARQTILRNRFGGSSDPLTDIKKTNKGVESNTAKANVLLEKVLNKNDVIMVISG
jgi:hypothetical protein